MGMKIWLAQIEVKAAQPRDNAEKIIRIIHETARQGAGILVFPELVVPGYLIGDMWERPAFIAECEAWNREIVAATTDTDLLVIFGTVVSEVAAKGEDGRPRRYNALLAAQKGQRLSQVGGAFDYGMKTLSPNYREFDESRYFYDTRKRAADEGRSWEDYVNPFDCVWQGERLTLGLVICEDSWDEDYRISPTQVLVDKGAALIINLSASPFTSQKRNKRHRIFQKHARERSTPILYANHVGVQNNGKDYFIFDGSSAFYTKEGAVIECAKFCGEETLEIGDFQAATKQLEPAPLIKERSLTPSSPWQDYEALLYGTQKTIEQMGLNKIVIGVSGGIDSAVVAAMMRAILPPENILLVNMPSRFNSDTTKNLAKELSNRLGCYACEIEIESSVKLTQKQINGLHLTAPGTLPPLSLQLSDQHLENVQARDRSSRILAALATAWGGVFTCNANKAETAVGYSTLYGDHGGFLAPLADLWKHQVYAFGRYLNEQVYRAEMIPEGIFTIVPSAELSLAQAVDEGKGDPIIYPYHDFLFKSWIQRWNRATPEENLDWYLLGTIREELGCSVDVYQFFPDVSSFCQDLERWWNLYAGFAIAKRVQSPPLIVLSSRAFGYDQRESIGRPYYSPVYHAMKRDALTSESSKAAHKKRK